MAIRKRIAFYARRPCTFGAQGGAECAGLLFGAGTAASKASAAEAGHFIQFYLENTATSGISRGMYLRLYHNGAGATGEALRAFTTVQQIVGSAAHGAHVSLNFDTSGRCPGLGVGLRATLNVPDRALLGGTYAALQAELYCDGNSASVAGVTEHSLLRLVVDGGNATAQNLIKNAIAVRATAQTDGTGQMVYTHTHTPGDAAGSIRILVNGVVRYLKFWAAE